MRSYKDIINDAIAEYTPIHCLLMFSGGHDSLVSTHVCATYLKSREIPFSVYHGDTSIGIKETQDFVRETCEANGWELNIRRPEPGQEYEDIVEKHGFPGAPGHGIMYRRLKERPLRKFVTHELKMAPKSRENVLLLTGIRKSESLIRMGYDREISKDGSRVWVSPIFWWSKKECEKYISFNKLKRNPVKDKICISGECLCGAFGSNEELAEIKASYPAAYQKIAAIHEKAKANGKPWPWSCGPNEWYRNHPPGQLDMFMCVGCEEKKYRL